MRRLNVQFSQIEECIRKSLFAVDALPRSPELCRGEELLLQLVKFDAHRLGKLTRRIEFALIFERALDDPDGRLSRAHWPNAGKTWRYILECSETIPTVPFSLENLPLSKDYSGQANPQYIEPSDEAIIRPFLVGVNRPMESRGLMGVRDMLTLIRNHDLVMQLSPSPVSRDEAGASRLSTSALSDLLKTYYEHRCQVCLHEFDARYGVPFADTRFLVPLEEGGESTSRNLVVLCPNHDAIIGVTRAAFEHSSLSFRYPNGVRERLILRDHFL